MPQFRFKFHVPADNIELDGWLEVKDGKVGLFCNHNEQPLLTLTPDHGTIFYFDLCQRLRELGVDYDLLTHR